MQMSGVKIRRNCNRDAFCDNHWACGIVFAAYSPGKALDSHTKMLSIRKTWKRRPQLTPLERLEEEANDEFRLLADVGPQHFSADHLLELRERMRQNILLFMRRQRLAMVLAGTGTGWLFMAFLSGFMQFRYLSMAAYGVASLSLTTFLAIVFWQKWRFNSKGELDYTMRSIEDELRRRAEKKRLNQGQDFHD